MFFVKLPSPNNIKTNYKPRNFVEITMIFVHNFKDKSILRNIWTNLVENQSIFVERTIQFP